MGNSVGGPATLWSNEMGTLAFPKGNGTGFVAALWETGWDKRKALWETEWVLQQPCGQLNGMGSVMEQAFEDIYGKPCGLLDVIVGNGMGSAMGIRAT